MIFVVAFPWLPSYLGEGDLGEKIQSSIGSAQKPLSPKVCVVDHETGRLWVLGIIGLGKILIVLSRAEKIQKVLRQQFFIYFNFIFRHLEERIRELYTHTQRID